MIGGLAECRYCLSHGGNAAFDQSVSGMTTLSLSQQPFFARLSPVWREARRALDEHGPLYRGNIRAGGLDSRVASCLHSLIGRPPYRALPLSALESVLADKGVGDNLDEALTQLGFPPMTPVERAALDRDFRPPRRPKPKATQKATSTPLKKSAAPPRRRRVRPYDILKEAVATWSEAWADEWVERLIASKVDLTDIPEVWRCALDMRRLLDFLDSNKGVAFGRADVAVRVFGNAHALDKGVMATFAHYAFQSRLREYHLDKSELWERAGIKDNQLCSPVLAWGLPAMDDTPVGKQIRTANRNNLPVHITRYAMSLGPLGIPRGAKVLAVENPRMIEAAAERKLSACLISTNGFPGSTFKVLLRQLLRSGAEVRFHTDFDTAGFSIGRTLHQEGCEPWRMTHRDYLGIIERAKREGVPLSPQSDPRPCPPVPWDPALRRVYQSRRLAVHQELLLDDILDSFALHSNYRDMSSQ